jgi:hypothetical protein
MVALWVVIIILVQSVVLVFALSLCKSASMADRQFEKAYQNEQNKWAASSRVVDSGSAIPVSVEARHTAHANSTANVHGR